MNIKGKNWRDKTDYLNSIDATYLRLCSDVMSMWTEWRLKDGTIVRVYFDEGVNHEHKTNQNRHEPNTRRTS